ncbi:MAG: methylitaconate Delta-isomerase [Thermoanaerobacteraceae bacterium]|nr:methylitaconate Delta-isomerase [Thermosediminibacterales bacterium]MDN5313023.1 methylitaconate Delta-isomerase [Thermoanaerobacteraceae bacterium]
MHPEMEMLRCVIMRGGTSKGIYIMKNQLPENPEKRDAVIRAIFGSPDIRQIDGLGGADPLTSKLAIISPSSRDDADVDYTFAQVSIDTPLVDYKGNCGNISAGVGPFAIDEGLVKAVEPITTVRIHQTNSGKILVAEVPVKDGKAAVDGDLHIDGVPGTGAKITIDFSDTQGAITGKLLPTGNPKDVIEIGEERYEVSIVDAGNPVVFIKAEELGMKGTETPQQIEENKSLMDKIEQIRGRAAEKIGLVDTWNKAVLESPYIPFFAIVSPPQNYNTYNHLNIKAEDVDLVSRLLFMLRMHKTYPGTGTVCTGAAARIPGSVVWDVLREDAKFRVKINIGHPGGIIPVESIAETKDGTIILKKAAIYRTARRIMEGYVYIRKNILEEM